jgi:DNA polymerase-3 subunit epsilon
MPPRRAWPRLLKRAPALPRGASQRPAQPASSYMARLVQRLPAAGAGDSRAHATYLELLDRAMEDRCLTSEESEALAGAAKLLDLSIEDVKRVNLSYLEGLASAANADGVVTAAESEDLRDAAGLLGLESAEVEAALRRTAQGSIVAPQASRASELLGATVCFTGELRGLLLGQPISRDMAHELATLAGLEVRTNVSKQLKILVVADPDTQSGKAKKARAYGTRIMTEAAFFRAIGVTLEAV